MYSRKSMRSMIASGDQIIVIRSLVSDAHCGCPIGNPFPDLVVTNGYAGIDRGDRLFDPGHLPLVDVQIFVNGLSGEERATAAGVLGKLF